MSKIPWLQYLLNNCVAITLKYEETYSDREEGQVIETTGGRSGYPKSGNILHRQMGGLFALKIKSDIGELIIVLRFYCLEFTNNICLSFIIY